jgi:hypothetical protein
MDKKKVIIVSSIAVLVVGGVIIARRIKKQNAINNLKASVIKKIRENCQADDCNNSQIIEKTKIFFSSVYLQKDLKRASAKDIILYSNFMNRTNEELQNLSMGQVEKLVDLQNKYPSFQID